MHQKTIVGCMYVIGYDNSKSQPERPCLFGIKRKDNGELVSFNLPPEEGYKMWGHGVIEVHGCGLGTTLIHKSVLNKIKFWHDDSMIKHSDVFMYMELHNLGWKVYCDTDIIIPHFNSDWNLVKDFWVGEWNGR